MSLAKTSLLAPMWDENWSQNRADSFKLQASLLETKTSAENKKLRFYKRRFQLKIRSFELTNQVFNVKFKDSVGEKNTYTHARTHTHTHTHTLLHNAAAQQNIKRRHCDTQTQTNTRTHTHAGMRKLCINKQRLQMKERHFTLRISSSHALLKKTAHIVDPCYN